MRGCLLKHMPDKVALAELPQLIHCKEPNKDTRTWNQNQGDCISLGKNPFVLKIPIISDNFRKELGEKRSESLQND